MQDFQILEYLPRQLAEQLTIIDAEIFSCIKPSEFYHTAWCKKDKETISPNIMRAINRYVALLGGRANKKHTRFNHLSFWMQKQLVTPTDCAKRVELLQHFIQIGKVP